MHAAQRTGGQNTWILSCFKGRRNELCIIQYILHIMPEALSIQHLCSLRSVRVSARGAGGTRELLSSFEPGSLSFVVGPHSAWT